MFIKMQNRGSEQLDQLQKSDIGKLPLENMEV